jgi:hypothetical protein
MRYYYLYKITDLQTNKIYIGVHETENVNDGYMGSGTVIRGLIKKHGVERFQKDIIEFFENRDAMYSREEELVTQDFCNESTNYNITPGGKGGSILLNRKPFSGPHSDESKKKIGDSSKNRTITPATRQKLSDNNFSKRDPIRQREHAINAGKHRWEINQNPPIKNMSEDTKQKLRTANLGKKHTDATKEKMSNKRKLRPKQRWIHSLFEKKSKMIGIHDTLPNGWAEGRKLKF